MIDKTEAQPEALRLAGALEESIPGYPLPTLLESEAAAELRRQHAEIQQIKAELSGHKAARMAYANEFPLNEDGEPDVGNIHANIRKLKSELITQTNRAASAEQQVLALTKRLDMSNAMGNEARHKLAQLSRAQAVPLIARQLGEWHEDDGPVMWWAWNGSEWAGEPAWCGTPLSSDWPGYHTHWTPHPNVPAAHGIGATND